MTTADNHDWESPAPSVIETAAGTTSSDNANSGNIAYVLAAVAIASLAVVGLGFSSILRFAAHMVEQSGGTGDFYGNVIDMEGDTGSPYDLIDQYMDGPRDYDDLSFLTQREKGLDLDDDKDGKVTSTEALGANLGIYAQTIDSLLPQSSYANSQAEVRSFVRELVLVDRDASSELASSLQTTAWKEGDIKAAIKDASAKADKLVKELQAMKLPEATGDQAKDIAKSLETGKGKAVERWKAIAEELELIGSSDELDEDKVQKADEKVVEAAEDAADALSEAMVESAKR